uniref:Uncharacterized protein n=1 Tax=Parascaris univalens TaxID=6257 RepID=A0A915CG03_PARUN
NAITVSGIYPPIECNNCMCGYIIYYFAFLFVIIGDEDMWIAGRISFPFHSRLCCCVIAKHVLYMLRDGYLYRNISLLSSRFLYENYKYNKSLMSDTLLK